MSSRLPDVLHRTDTAILWAGPELSESRLARIPEAIYRAPDIDRAVLPRLER